MTKIHVYARIIGGYSDAPTGESETADFWCDLPGVPRKGDSVATGYGDHTVEWVHWGRDGGVLVQLGNIYTLTENLEHVVARFGAATCVFEADKYPEIPGPPGHAENIEVRFK